MSNNDYYFWLGADGLKEVTEEEFEDNQREYREALDAWINVRVKPVDED